MPPRLGLLHTPLLCFPALLLGIILGAEYMLWAWAALFVAVAAFGLTPSHGDLTEPTAHFGLPVSFNASPTARMVKDGTFFAESPLILYQVNREKVSPPRYPSRVSDS